MIEYYPQIKLAHVVAVALSGVLFAARGALMLAHSRWSNHAALRYLSYTIDSVLLTTALLLVTLLRQYPFVQTWLTVKVLLLAGYIVLGSLALKRGRTRSIQVLSYCAALALFLLIVSVAIAHHPFGILHSVSAWLA